MRKWGDAFLLPVPQLNKNLFNNSLLWNIMAAFCASRTGVPDPFAVSAGRFRLRLFVGGEFMRNQKGFSLIELLLVVAVILIIAAIAIPSFLHSRMRANEASTVASLRLMLSSAVTYSNSYPDLGYPANLTNLGGASPCTPSPAQACLIDDSLAVGTKDGYSFVWTGDGLVPSFGFFITATPLFVGSSGQNMYCTDQTGVIRADRSGSGCTNISSPIQ
jgi:prepilin-type N-terminal cleavage/methylation domain-containing protein